MLSNLKITISIALPNNRSKIPLGDMSKVRLSDISKARYKFFNIRGRSGKIPYSFLYCDRIDEILPANPTALIQNRMVDRDFDNAVWRSAVWLEVALIFMGPSSRSIASRDDFIDSGRILRGKSLGEMSLKTCLIFHS